MLRTRVHSGLRGGSGGLRKERKCMQSAKEKRQKQLEALEYVERFRGTIWDATMQVLHDPYLAEDAFQETALRFLRYYHSVDTSMDVFVKYYLKEIARNAALTVYKRHHKIALCWGSAGQCPQPGEYRRQPGGGADYAGADRSIGGEIFDAIDPVCSRDALQGDCGSAGNFCKHGARAHRLRKEQTKCSV